jgi:hypothetical protein
MLYRYGAAKPNGQSALALRHLRILFEKQYYYFGVLKRRLGRASVNRYPRDMTGYGAHPPKAQWPNGAKIAVQIVLNYEEGGENNILHGDPASEAFLSEITGAAAWPDQRHWNMESLY